MRECPGVYPGPVVAHARIDCDDAFFTRRSYNVIITASIPGEEGGEHLESELEWGEDEQWVVAPPELNSIN